MKEITLDYTAIGPRLRTAREQANLTLQAAAIALDMRNINALDIDAAERGAKELPAVALCKLAIDIYQCELSDLLHGPYPYQSRVEWIQAYMRAEIGEGLLAKGLRVDRLEARRHVQEYERAEPQI